MLPPLTPPAQQAPPVPTARPAVSTLKPAPKPAVNTVCPVLGEPVDAESPTVVVKGRTFRVCCPPCAGKLKANPGQYLSPEGVPLNHHLEIPAAKAAATAKAAPVPFPKIPRNQAPHFLPPELEALLVAQPKSSPQGENRLPMAWVAPDYDRTLGLAAAELRYLPEPRLPEVLAAWTELTTPRLRPGSPYRLEAAVTWMEPAEKVKASGITLVRSGTLCVEGLVRNGAGKPMAAFRAETLFTRDQKTFTPTRPTVAVLLSQITATLPM